MSQALWMCTFYQIDSLAGHYVMNQQFFSYKNRCPMSAN